MRNPKMSYEAHALAASAELRLDHDGIAERVRFTRQRFDILSLAFVSRQHGNSGIRHDRFRLRFLAHRPNHRGRWTDEANARRLARLRKLRVLGEKAVPGMNGLRRSVNGRGEQRALIEIALPSRSRSESDRDIGGRNVEGTPVGVGVHGDSAQPQPLRGPHDPAGDLASIGNQQRFEHQSRPRR